MAILCRKDVADAIINCGHADTPSFWLPIGKVAFRNMEQTLEKRLDEVKALKERTAFA